MRAHGLERSCHGIGRMGVIHKDRSPVFAGGRQLHSAAHGCQMLNRFKHTGRFGTACNHKPAGQQHVFGLKPADEVEPRLVNL